MKKKLLILGLSSFACLGAIGTGVAIEMGKKMPFVGAESDNIWVHYAKKDATKDEKGIREYWVNCQTNEHRFVAPTAGSTVNEGTAYDTSGFASDDDRWIYNITLTAQDVLMTDTAKAIDLGDYAGGTISSIKADSFDLGTDAANLDVGDFATDHSDDGLKSVCIEMMKDEKAYVLYCDTTFVTATITTAAEYQERIISSTEIKKGYFKLMNDIDIANGQKIIDGFGFDWNYGFSGTLDGNGKTITCKSGAKNGAFSNLIGATIKDLTLADGWYSACGCASLIARAVTNTTFSNVKTKVTNGGTGNTTIENNRGYLAYGKFMNNKLTDCEFDASGRQMSTLIGRGQNFNDANVFSNCVVKASELVEAMYSVYLANKGLNATFQPSNVTLKDGEVAIQGLTYVQA